MLITNMVWIGFLLVLLVLLLFGYVAYRYYWQHMIQLPKPSYRSLEHKPTPASWSDHAVTFTWIGHSTLLLNIFGTKVITDPVLGEKLGIRIAGKHFGPSRFTPPALTCEEIGEIDLVLLSHAHMDHVDLPTLRQLAKHSIHVMTAQGTSRLIRHLPFGSYEEIQPHQQTSTADGLKITAIPVRHWGNRFPWNRDYGYNGYIIEKNGVRILYPGDTAYMSMEHLKHDFGPIDLVFMPIGAYKPDSYQAAHCTPEQAWQMFEQTGGKWLVPIHWNTFVLSREPVEEPMERLLAVASEQRYRIVVEKQGQTYSLPL